MKDIFRNYLNTFVRVRDFGAENPVDFKPDTAAGQNMAAVAAAVDALEQAGAAQASGAASQTTMGKSLALADIRAGVRAINKTARAIAVDDPPVAELFRMPAGNNEQTLLAAARAFITNATPMQAQFVAFGLPATFLTDLQDDIDEYDAAVAARDAATDAQIAATASIETAVHNGLDALRRLRAIVQNIYHDNPAKLAAWTSASHVERPAKKKATQPVTPTP
jgi:hypothetical protein